ncbi:MAG: permease-like cell division protein FtsX [Bacteroidales bacterium]|nr:permease-like cell division protein FtsX [Bacteroidales bacterium]MCK5337389.1 permease-like cell division protein FtsX [Bacteroidales bacterium]
MAKKDERLQRRKLQSSRATALISITLVLLMVGLLGLIVLHAQKLSEYVRENIGFSIIMKENVREAGIVQLQKTLDASRFVKSTEYITPEQAAEELQEELGEDFISFLGYNPLLPSIELKLKAEYTNIDSMEMIENELLADTDVKEIYYQKDLVHLINKNIRRIGLVLLGFSVLLLVIAVALINNTIRLSVYSKRFLIKTMQLVGATGGFIRRPFLWYAVMQGLYAAFIAIICLGLLLYFFQKELPELVNLQDPGLILSLFGLVLLTGIVLTYLSTWFAVKKYLRAKADRLYY